MVFTMMSWGGRTVCLCHCAIVNNNRSNNNDDNKQQQQA